MLLNLDRMCCRKIFLYWLCDLFNLPRRHFHIEYSFYKLYKLLDRSVSGLDWFNSLFCLSRWNLLRDDWPLSGDGDLRCRKIFRLFIQCLFKLPNRNVFG